MDLNETLKMIVYMLLPAFISLLGMAALGSPAIAFLGEVTGKTQQKVFYDKYGQQTGFMGLWLTLFVIAVYGVTIGALFLKSPELIEKLKGMSAVFIQPAATFGVFAVAALLYFPTWKKMRSMKGAHMALGAIAALAGLASISFTIFSKVYVFTVISNLDEAKIKTAAAMATPLSIMYVCLALASAAALSLPWLVARRNKDDYGRDYYGFALKIAARWSVVPMIAYLGCQGWLFSTLPVSFRALITGTPLGYVWIALTGLGVISVFCWMALIKSNAPLRLKWLTYLAAVLLVVMHALGATLFVNIMSMF